MTRRSRGGWRAPRCKELVFGAALASVAAPVATLGLTAAATDARAFDFFGLFGDKKPEPSADAVTYEVSFEADGHRSLASAMQNASTLYRLRKDAPPDGMALAQRAAIDLAPLVDAMWAEGFYDAAVSIDVAGVKLQLPVSEATLQAAGRAASAMRGRQVVPVTVSVDPGEQYTLSSVAVKDAQGRMLTGAELPANVLKIGDGDPARAGDLRAASARAVDWYRAQSYPLAKGVDIGATVNHDTRTMAATIVVSPGQMAPIGEVEVRNAGGARPGAGPTVDPRVIRSFIYLEPGEPYSPKKLADTRRSLTQLPILGGVRVTTPDRLDAEGRIPVFVDVTERLPRVIGFSAGYSTVDGPNVRAYWEHRNLFGGAEQLRLEGSIFVAPRNDGTRRKGVADLNEGDFGGRFRATFIKPALGGTRNDLIVEAMAERDRTGGDRYGGYTVRDVQATASIRHRISDVFSVQGGLKVERGQTSDVLSSIDYTLVGTPVSVTYDSTDNPLDATRGFKVVASATPYPSFLGSTVNFTEGKLTASTYYAVDEDARIVLAGRVTLGMLGGPKLSDIPANHRFYAGGAASVRGYRLNSLGPQDGRFGFVVGGRSLLTVNLEARIKITDTIGVVPFFDAGNAFESTTPHLKDKLYKAAGIGLRYYTPIGPIRADFAFPLDRRKGDRPVSMYISIGQSF